MVKVNEAFFLKCHLSSSSSPPPPLFAHSVAHTLMRVQRHLVIGESKLLTEADCSCSPSSILLFGGEGVMPYPVLRSTEWEAFFCLILFQLLYDHSVITSDSHMLITRCGSRCALRQSCRSFCPSRSSQQMD